MQRRSTNGVAQRRSTRLQKPTDGDLKKEQRIASDSESGDERQYEFEGTVYTSYEEMVKAKRKRNEDYLKQNGLWMPSARFQQESAAQKASSNGIKKRKITKKVDPLPRRSSNRLRGTPADGRFVQHEGGGSFVIAGQENQGAGKDAPQVESATRRSRANDGSPLSVEEAVNLCEPKWVHDTSVETAGQLTKEIKDLEGASQPNSPAVSSSKDATTDELLSQIQNLSVDDDNLVAKVTPDRIYSVATHPGKQKLIVGAGDKNGYVGLWNVDLTSENESSKSTDGVHLFRYHTRPVNSLQWTSHGLLSSSYDGTVRFFDVVKESFEEVFSTNEDDDAFYTQYLALDPRANKDDQSFFLSTSIGSVMHVDRRIGGRNKGSVTWHSLLSDEGKKINSVR